MPNFNYKIIIVIYMVIMSVIGFVSMGIDKKRAINKKWRIPEKTLFIIAFLGGAAGSVLGMRIFKHKTKHMKFVILCRFSSRFKSRHCFLFAFCINFQCCIRERLFIR